MPPLSARVWHSGGCPRPCKQAQPAQQAAPPAPLPVLRQRLQPLCRICGSASSPSARSAAEPPEAATSRRAAVRSLSHLCPHQVRGAAGSHAEAGTGGTTVPAGGQERSQAQACRWQRNFTGAGVLLRLGGLCSATKWLSLQSGPGGGTLPAEWQPMSPRGCAVAGKRCHFPQGGLWGTGVLQKATVCGDTPSRWDPKTFVAICCCPQSAAGPWRTGAAPAACGTHKAEVLT